jgi:Domain of unknown function (DUF1937)
MIYIASPYSHSNSEVCAERFRIVTLFAAHLIDEGEVPFSPITHGHTINEVLKACNHVQLPTDAGFWNRQNSVLQSRASSLVVLMLPGYVSSMGVTQEIELAKRIFQPITYWTATETNNGFIFSRELL